VLSLIRRSTLVLHAITRPIARQYTPSGAEFHHCESDTATPADLRPHRPHKFWSRKQLACAWFNCSIPLRFSDTRLFSRQDGSSLFAQHDRETLLPGRDGPVRGHLSARESLSHLVSALPPSSRLLSGRAPPASARMKQTDLHLQCAAWGMPRLIANVIQFENHRLCNSTGPLLRYGPDDRIVSSTLCDKTRPTKPMRLDVRKGISFSPIDK
jgi:hypothetical protein